MAATSAPVCSGYTPDGIRWLGDLEGGVHSQPERVPDPGGVRVHGPVSKSRDHRDLVRSWIILIFVSATSSAAATAGILQVVGR